MTNLKELDESAAVAYEKKKDLERMMRQLIIWRDAIHSGEVFVLGEPEEKI